MTYFIKVIRDSVIDSIMAKKLTDIMYGTVTSVQPLKISVEQKMEIDEDHLKLTKAVRNYETKISINGGMKQSCTVYNALEIGDIVTLIRAHGGQQYIVIDKEG